MLKSIYNLIFLSIFILLAFPEGMAQTKVSGRVTNATSGDPIPFANVFYTGTQTGTTTDFNGFFILNTLQGVDSVTVSYVGYLTRTKAIRPGETQEINFQLDEQVMNLQEVVFYAGENPAFKVLRKVVENKQKNDKRSLDAYQYESYNKIEIDLDNISEKLRKKPVMRKITQVLDSVDRIAGEDGKPILPLFISESITEYYYRKSPKLKHEKIIKTKISGVGVEDGTLVSQFIGTSFQEYNFYENWLKLIDKDFVSPIADGWKMHYEYDLTDSGLVDGHYCYKLDFFPKTAQDLAFHGTIWITKKEYALKQIDASVLPVANLNYVEKIRIQQELIPTEIGAWLPKQTRILIDIGELSNGMAGMLAKFYLSNKNVRVNNPLDEKFYARPIEMVRGYDLLDEKFWEKNRHEPLSSTEKSVYAMIDTLNNLPVVRTYTDILKIAVNGFKKAGPMDIGPYLSLYANNNIEGHRFQIGGRTNISFSDKIVLGGYAAYGTEDNRFKFNSSIELIPDKLRWTSLKAEYTQDIDQVGLAAEDLSNNNLFLTATRFGNLKRPFYFNRYRITLRRELFKGFSQAIFFKNEDFTPRFPFNYIKEPNNPDSPHGSRFKFSEVSIESRYAKDELTVVNDNQKLSLGTVKWPVFSFRYTRGIKGFLGGQHDYHKVRLNIRNDITIGFFGKSTYSITGEQIFGSLPYPLLKAHIGNESMFYTTAAFNLMNYSEFISDRYVSLKYQHNFEGFILNRIPVIRKLKWRVLATGNLLYGKLSHKNRALIPEMDGKLPDFSLQSTPYVEVGYGIENIFKVGRIDFIHRLTHLDKPDVNKFGIKVSLQFIL